MDRNEMTCGLASRGRPATSPVIAAALLAVATLSPGPISTQTAPTTVGGTTPRDWTLADLDHVTGPLERGGAPDAQTLERGATLYGELCSVCHGPSPASPSTAAGPTLAQLLMRFSAAETLGHILAPSDFVAANYQLRVIELEGGRQLDGVVVEETATTVILRPDPLTPEQTIEVALEKIRESWTLPLSPMPEDLLRHLDDRQIGDLLSYVLWAPP